MKSAWARTQLFVSRCFVDRKEDGLWLKTCRDGRNKKGAPKRARQKEEKP
jgi:hypothetical protein